MGYPLCQRRSTGTFRFQILRRIVDDSRGGLPVEAEIDVGCSGRKAEERKKVAWLFYEWF